MDAGAERRAVEWFVDNEAGDGLEAERLLAWQSWLEKAENRSEYSAVFAVKQGASTLRRPTLPDDEALRRDFASITDTSVTTAKSSIGMTRRRELFGRLSRHPI